MSLPVELLILVGLVIATGVLSAAETAILSASKANLRRSLKAGEPGAANALALAETPMSFLLLVQLWLTLGGTIAGVLGGAELAADVHEHLLLYSVPPAWAGPLSFVLVALGLASVLLIFGELLPKRIASTYPEATACRLAGTIRVLEWLTAPLTKVLSLFTGRLNRVLGSRQQAAPAAGDDEVRALVEQGLNAGVIHRAEKEMVDRVLALDNLRITSLMTPRPKIVFLNINDTDEANWRKIVASGHSYFPVYQGNRDHVVGMVAVKALWANSAIGLPAKLRDLVTPHLAVPDRITAIQLLEQFKRSGRHHAVVANEFGAVVGLVTLIDVLEAIVGDLPEAGQKNQPAARQRRDGTWLVDAELPVEDLKKLLKLEQSLPREGEAEFKTIGGFMLSQFGRVPKETEYFEWSGWRFEVVDMDRLRIDKILVSRSPAPEPKAPEAASAPAEDGGQ